MASDFAIRHAAHIVHRGGIIAYPTDTIYGLGCDPFNIDAIERLNRIKQRPASKHFILLAGELAQIRSLLAVSDTEAQTLNNTDEPTSWIVPATASAPPWLTDTDNNLTVRLCDHEDVRRLCQRLGHAIISTSANLAGHRPAQNALQLHQRFQCEVDKILVSDKPLRGKASRIIRLRDNRTIRA